MSATLYAFVPARAGSKRIVAKNIRPLAGHPLIAYTLAAARASSVFTRVIVSTDSLDIAQTAKRYGAEAPFLRPSELAGDRSPDIEWIRHLLAELRARGEAPDAFSILRPTSPFRQPDTIQRAAKRFLGSRADSLRAVQKVTEHPGKMWVRRGEHVTPLLPFSSEGTRWQSTPYQALPEVYVQNASLEIAWTRTVEDKGSIEGDLVLPFFSEGYEGFDLNDEVDWIVAEQLHATGRAKLPVVEGVPADG